MIDGRTVKELYESDYKFLYILKNHPVSFACDYLRLKLIEEYNFPVFMDLDYILYNKQELIDYNFNYDQPDNASYLLIKNNVTRDLYRYIKENYKKYNGDGSIKIKTYFKEKVWPKGIGLSWTSNTLDNHGHIIL